jgi:hypothetical protein
MTEKNSKKSYYLPDMLTDYFAEWCAPGRDYSSKMAGAMLLWMALEDLPEIRQAAEKLAHDPNVKRSLSKIKKQVYDAVLKSQVADIPRQLGIDEAQFLAALRPLLEQSSRE